MTPEDIARLIASALGTAESRPPTTWGWSVEKGATGIAIAFRSECPHVLDLVALQGTFESVSSFHWREGPDQPVLGIVGKCKGRDVSATFALTPYPNGQ